VWKARLGDEHVHDQGVDAFRLEDVLGDHEHVAAALGAAEERGLVALGRHEVTENSEEAGAEPEGVLVLHHEWLTRALHNAAVGLQVRETPTDVDDFDVADGERRACLRVDVALRGQGLHNNVCTLAPVVDVAQLARCAHNGGEEVVDTSDCDVAADGCAAGAIRGDGEQMGAISHLVQFDLKSLFQTDDKVGRFYI
jgi:hypothetical protein